MANPLYGGYSSAYGGGASYSSRLSTDPYLSSSSRYANPDHLAPSSEITKYSSSSLDFGSSLYSSYGKPGQSLWSGFDGSGFLSGTKRSAEALYHSNVLGSHNTIGQSDALYSSNSMFKHPRIETASNLPIYPQRPGEKDCAHYMLTRNCKFGEACKFDHPIWVPEGGIPDWKEVPLAPTSESLPERPGETDCPYYMKTQKCKFGFRCKFNHPKDKSNTVAVGDVMGAGSVDHLLPERPSEPICAFYSKTGKCKFGANCKYHHPKDVQIPASGQNSITTEQVDSARKDTGIAGSGSAPAKTFVPVTPALLHNSKGLPVRPGETDCPFYLKTGSCKYGATCRYNHPDRTFGNVGQSVIPSAAAGLPLGLFNQATNLIPNIDPLLAQASLGVSSSVYPQRPGELECDFYMKTGQCKFGERCRFHHPIDRSAPNPHVAQVIPNVKLTLAGLPRREGSVACPFYMKTGTCKYGVACKFDHPPPGEAVAMATAQGSAGGDGKAAADSPEGEE